MANHFNPYKSQRIQFSQYSGNDSQAIYFQQQNSQPQAASWLPPNLEQRSVSQKRHIRQRKRLKSLSLARESNGALTMRKCFAAVWADDIIIIRMVSYILNVY